MLLLLTFIGLVFADNCASLWYVFASVGTIGGLCIVIVLCVLCIVCCKNTDDNVPTPPTRTILDIPQVQTIQPMTQPTYVQPQYLMSPSINPEVY